MNQLEAAGGCFRSMNFIEGSDRHQTHRFPAALKDYAGANNLVRLLDAFVAKLDLPAADFALPKADPPGRGRPAYAPVPPA